MLAGKKCDARPAWAPSKREKKSKKSADWDPTEVAVLGDEWYAKTWEHRRGSARPEAIFGGEMKGD